MKSKINLLFVALLSFLIVSTIPANGQNWKALKEKAKKEAAKKLKNKENSNTNTNSNTNSNSNTNTNNSNSNTNSNTNSSTTTTKPVIPEKTLLEKIAEEQKEIIANNKANTNNDSNGEYKDVSIPAYLSFTNDYTKKDANMLSFTGKDYIYAKLNMDKALTEILPDENASGLQYYRIKVIVKVEGNYGDAESNVKTKKREYFKYAYNTKDLLIAIVPEKAYFESIKKEYTANNKPLSEAYYEILSRNFGSAIATKFGYLSTGQYKVEVEFQVTAKLRSSLSYTLQNIKGVFMITTDEQSKKKFANDSKILNSLYYAYEEESEDLYYTENQDKILADKQKVMESYKNDPNKGVGNNNFKINIKNTNTGQSVRIIAKDSRGTEKIITVTPGSTQTLELFKSQTYSISVYGQSAAKSTARKVATVTNKNNGQTISVR